MNWSSKTIWKFWYSPDICNIHEFSFQENWKQMSVATFGNFKALQQEQAAEL